jgi:hypothetical protein
MALKTKFSVNISCPRHPRYDPTRGEGYIVGGCRNCYALLDVLPLIYKFRKVVSQFGETLQAKQSPKG